MVEQAGDCITERRQHPASVIKSTLVPESNKSSSYYPHGPASSQQPGAWCLGWWRQGRRVAASWRQLGTGGGGGLAWCSQSGAGQRESRMWTLGSDTPQ